jgi:TRAP-type C4-dicarboxylate transport system permease small subunit
MKAKILLTCALLAFFAGVGLLIAAWQGSSSVTAAWPMSSSAVQLSGAAKGWRAMAGLAGLALAVVLFFWSLISLLTRGLRRSQQEELSPASAANRQAASH